MELCFVDEREFQKQGKSGVGIDHLTISCEFNRSLDDKYDSEEVFDRFFSSSSDGIMEVTAIKYREEALMFAGDTRGAKSTEEQKRKQNSSGKLRKNTRRTAGKNANPSASSSLQGSTAKNKSRKGKVTNRGGKKNVQMLTEK